MPLASNTPLLSLSCQQRKPHPVRWGFCVDGALWLEGPEEVPKEKGTDPLGPVPNNGAGRRFTDAGGQMGGALLALPVVAPLPLAVAPPAGPLLFEPLLLRGLHVGHVLPILLQHTTPVHLTPEALERAINVFVVSDFYTNSQGRSLRREFGFEIEWTMVKLRSRNANVRGMFLFRVLV